MVFPKGKQRSEAVPDVKTLCRVRIVSNDSTGNVREFRQNRSKLRIAMGLHGMRIAGFGRILREAIIEPDSAGG